MADNVATSAPFPNDEAPGPTKPVYNQSDNVTIQLAEMVHNVMSRRMDWLQQLLDPRRDVADECGFPKGEIPIADYQHFYDRFGPAARVVEVYPRECWQTRFELYEKEKGSVETPFEEAWNDLTNSLRGEKSWYKDQDGSPVMEALQRADEQSGIGHYGIILLGFNDGLPLDQPVKGVEEAGSLPVDSEKKDPEETAADTTPGVLITGHRVLGHNKAQVYKFIANAEETKGRKLKYLRVFPESLVAVTRFESNLTSPRYGQPIQYLITLNDPRNSYGGIGAPMATISVHWTRVIHVADNLTSSEWFGTPRMQQVYDHIHSLHKVESAAPEGYWQQCFPILSIESNPQAQGDVPFTPKLQQDMKDALEKLRNSLQKELVLTGFAAKMLPPTVNDPTAIKEMLIEAICIKLGCPKRVFLGSERGELASSQDDQAWNDRLRLRQNNYITPRLIVPFVDRLILVGVLPEPGEEGYHVDWPDLTSQTDKEKADVMSTIATAVSTYVQSGASAIMVERDFLSQYFEDDVVDMMLENAMKSMEDGGTNDDTAPSPMIATVAGLTQLNAMFTAFSQGGLTLEQLKAQIMMVFKVTEEYADALIADGEEVAAPTDPMAEEGMAPPITVPEGHALVDPMTGEIKAQPDKLKDPNINPNKPQPVHPGFPPPHPGAGGPPGAGAPPGFPPKGPPKPGAKKPPAFNAEKLVDVLERGIVMNMSPNQIAEEIAKHMGTEEPQTFWQRIRKSLGL